MVLLKTQTSRRRRTLLRRRARVPRQNTLEQVEESGFPFLGADKDDDWPLGWCVDIHFSPFLRVLRPSDANQPALLEIIEVIRYVLQREVSSIPQFTRRASIIVDLCKECSCGVRGQRIEHLIQLVVVDADNTRITLLAGVDIICGGQETHSVTCSHAPV